MSSAANTVGGIRGRAHIAGIFEHPERHIPDQSLMEIHARVCVGALDDAGLSMSDVDAYFGAGDSPGFGPLSMIDYLGIKASHMDSTEMGGSSYVSHVNHAAAAIAAGKCRVALVSLAGKPRTGGAQPGARSGSAPEADFENHWGAGVPANYALAARRHMYEFGTTSEQLAEIKVAASVHAQHNPHAFLKDVVTVEEVVESPMIADPLHRLDCCVITDGGGAVVVTSPEVARDLDRPSAVVLGAGEAPKTPNNGRIDLTHTGAVWSGPAAFAEAGVTPADIDYVSIYDSFTITVLMTLEDLGFCEKGKGGEFVADGALQSPNGVLPFNTDGGGLCNNHPGNRGGMTKIIEAVRQVRGEANEPVQVPDCELALAHGTGGSLAARMGSATLILGRTSRSDPMPEKLSDDTAPDMSHTRPTELPTRPPRPNLDSQPFWDATAEGRFTLQRCTDCNTVIWWPRAICPECSSFDLARFDASGRGEVYSYTVVHRSVGRWNAVTPYVLAYVELEEGPRVMTNVVDCDPKSIEIGTEVEVVWHDTGEGTALPRFTPRTNP